MNAAEIHASLKKSACAVADLKYSRDTMVWRAYFSSTYKTYEAHYHRIFATPTANDILLYRKSIGETVMDTTPLLSHRQKIPFYDGTKKNHC